MSIAFLGRRFLVAGLGVALCLAWARPAPAAIINVGSGGPGAGCEAGDIPAALALADNSSAADEIRLVNTQLFTLSAGLHLTNWSANGALTISGGWDSCTDSSAGTNRSRILYTGSSPVIEIDTTAGGSSQVTLQTITIEDSTGPGLLVQGNSTVDLLRVLLENNDGGGLRVEGGASVYLDRFSTIQVNGPVLEGGALRCSGAGTGVTSAAAMRGNRAEFGGGVYAAAGCEVLFEEGAVLMDNVATGVRAGDGGAVYATGGSLVSAFGPVFFSSNSAGGSGGGIAAWGANTLVLLFGVTVDRNVAGVGGAGLYAAAGAQIAVAGDSCNGVFCPSVLLLNELLPGSGDGSAAMALNGGVIDIAQAYVRSNVVDEDEPHGSVFHAFGVGSAIRTESVVVADNSGADRVFEAASGGLIRAAFTTVARNRYFNSVGALVEALGIHVSGSASEARSYTSIYHPTAGFYVGPEVGDFQFDCLIVQTSSGLPSSASEVYVTNPAYLSLTGSNLRVNDPSPAVDFCDTFYFQPTVVDLDGRTRGYDHPDNPSASPGPIGAASIQDAGAYEIRELLRDGFETGNTSRWSGGSEP
jgi:predicted outer membrane repeat protein